MKISEYVLEPERFIRSALGLRKRDKLNFYKKPFLDEYSYGILDYFVVRGLMQNGKERVWFNLADLTKYLNDKFDYRFDEEETLIWMEPLHQEIFQVVVNEELPDYEFEICHFYKHSEKRELAVQFKNEVFKQLISFYKEHEEEIKIVALGTGGSNE